MAPSRKRGAKGVGTKSEMSLGDLVLAKVKGYPPWPAKIGRPEDWERAPDPKKYFVEFFGTEEIGFVAPADIQAFTNEVKDRLCARGQTKTVRHFAKAVKQICEEFEAIQSKSSSSLGDDIDKQDLGCEAPSVEQVASEVNIKDETDRDLPNWKIEIEGLGDQGSGLEHSSHRLSKTDCQDTKFSVSNDVNPSSLYRYSKKGNKLSTYGTDLSKESVSATYPLRHSFLKKEGSRDNKMEQRHSDGDQSELTNGHKLKLAIGSKRKPDGTNIMHRNSVRAVSAASACDNSGHHINISCEQSGDGTERKITSGGNTNDTSADISRSSLDVGRRKEKKLLKEKEHFGSADDCPKDTEVNYERNKVDVSREKITGRPGKQSLSFPSNEVPCPTKRSKFSDIAGDATKGKTQTNRTSDSQSTNVLDDIISITEPKRLTSGGNTENCKPFRFQSSMKDSNSCGNEDDLPPIKHCCGALEAMSNSSLHSENRLGNSSALKKSLSDKVRSSALQFPVKRRAVRLCDDDCDEEPKTPIHGGCATKVSLLPCLLDSTKTIDVPCESSLHDQQEWNGSGTVEDGSKGLVSSAIPHKASSPTAQKGIEKRAREIDDTHVRSSPAQVDFTNMSSRETKPVVFSPMRSPWSIASSKPSGELQSIHSGKTPVHITHKKAPSGSNIGVTSISDGSKSSLNQTTNERSKSAYLGGRMKTTPKTDLEVNDSDILVGNPAESITFLGERVVIGKNAKMSSSIDLKILDPDMSMKHLIAAAQAKRRQTHKQNSHGTPLVTSDVETPGTSPSPSPTSQGMKASNMSQLGIEGLHSCSSLTSPTSDFRQFSTNNRHNNEEFEERRVSSGHRAVGGSLSGGTEAAIARDSFEGMIETLSRTKESIGRATRLAIDCAKYGIANEVVELLTRKLENEPSFHHRVDLFFLVDSITQCSHGQKGIAGASYIPAVQAALSRLIGAAAPPGASAHENRRQCLKVLRLWLERKILPESVLRRCMNDIGAVNDDASAGFSFRHPSRAERAIDDPIREMEGMLVDEYGSNTTFKLHGLLSSHAFEEEEEEEEEEDHIQANLCKEVADASPSEGMPVNGDPENCAVTPSDKRHCILEDVDGELEMEDVSENQKDERPLSNDGAFETAKIQPDADMIPVSASNNSCELLPLPEGSPPLPFDSPPATPPLPTSPLPLPPPLPPSPSPSPPPQPLPSSQRSLFPPPHIGPSSLLPAPSSHPQPSLMSQNMARLSSSISSSLTAAYPQPPLPNEIASTPIGGQLAQMTTNTPHGPHIDTSVKNEVFLQQSLCFAPAGVGNAREHSEYNLSRTIEYGRIGSYMDMNSRQQLFHPGIPSFAQSPPHLNHPPNFISYPKTAVQQHPYPHYSLQNFSDGPRQYAADEQWRVQSNQFNSDDLCSVWMAGGRSCSASPFPNEGISGFPLERPPRSTVGFHPSAAAAAPPPPRAPIASPISGLTAPQMIPWRPEKSTVNWRPV
ncbi:ENHANCER OF AG-4 protein 2-like [Olea europaea var. sylvestris]|uniref:ENHANCER OF AG-4 protein 2-like n=1 Tax=Olea europaea var. sylvestris TaxID=158386 RepID=UPI000C1CEBF7|nr:ENHANCER OF AG-4 protein 2-like [Olea europaea var. sylvestris]